jgi:hypothetical protein
MFTWFPTLVSPGAEAETSLSEIPAKIDIGLTTPLFWFGGSWNNHCFSKSSTKVN